MGVLEGPAWGCGWGSLPCCSLDLVPSPSVVPSYDRCPAGA
jgi:hypothetical protein